MLAFFNGFLCYFQQFSFSGQRRLNFGFLLFERGNLSLKRRLAGFLVLEKAKDEVSKRESRRISIHLNPRGLRCEIIFSITHVKVFRALSRIQFSFSALSLGGYMSI